MNRLRFWIIVLTLWLIFVFNIERINSPINIRSYTYVFVAFAAVIALALPKTRRLSYLALLLIPIPSFLLFKVVARGQSLWGAALPLTVTQVSAILLTGLISRQISYGLRDVEKLIGDITTGYIGKLPKSFSETQDVIYRELRRARHHQRPLSVITFKVDKSSLQVALPKLIKKIQQAMMNEYILAGITRVLDENVSDFGTIALRDNCFIVVLPETTGDEALMISKDLKKVVQEKVSVNLLAGTASFPEEAVTFEALINVATHGSNQAELEQDQKEEVSAQDFQSLDVSTNNLNVSSSTYFHHE